MHLLLKGIIIGLSIAAPVGPIGLLCIKRTLTNGRYSGLVSGLGAATADSAYGAIAAFGLTLVSSLLIDHKQALSILGGIFLCYLGFKIITAKAVEDAVGVQSNKGLLSDYASTFLLTLTNPTTILSFIGIFAGLGLVSQSGSRTQPVMLVTGVFLGSASWWLFLSSVVGVMRHKISSQSMKLINRVSGTVIILFGIAALYSAI